MHSHGGMDFFTNHFSIWGISDPRADWLVIFVVTFFIVSRGINIPKIAVQFIIEVLSLTDLSIRLDVFCYSRSKVCAL